MSFWELDNLREVTGGRWIARPDAQLPPADLFGVSTDTRTIEPGQVFVAIRGPRFDGHDYIPQAIEAGAGLIIADRPLAEPARLSEAFAGVAIIQVADSVRALGRLGAACRQTTTAKVIAITGSVGKTTTKRMIDAILSPVLAGKASPKSFNNEIGVPLTLLSVEPRDRYVVVEIGTNAPGEVAALSRMAEPDVAIITHAAAGHTEKLGGVEGVAREKASMLNHLRSGGLAIVNGDVSALKPHLKLAPSLVTYGESEDCDLRLTEYEADFSGPTPAVRFQVNRRTRFTMPGLGKHTALNALAAIAVARHMNVNDDLIASGLAAFEPPDMRLCIEQIAPAPDQPAVTIINDAYNANPPSMAAAIDVLASYPEATRRVAIIGDMLELGDLTEAAHREVGEALAAAAVDLVVCLGPAMAHAAVGVRERRGDSANVQHFDDLTETNLRQIVQMLREGDVVLLKGSRGMAMERVAEAMRESTAQ